jgi:hypothetical protein
MIYSQSIVKCRKCSRPAKVGCSRCQICLAYEINRGAEKRKKLREEGKCITCGLVKQEGRARYNECLVCAMKHLMTSRTRHFRRRYRLTESDVAKLLNEQGGFCAFCGEKIKGKSFIDHDHYTKRVRGIVHPRCNTILGMVEQFGKDRLFTLLGQYAGGVW